MQHRGYAHVSPSFDWWFTLLSGWLIAGAFLDGWAHVHVESTRETFFSPWHGFFYAGILAITIFLATRALASYTRGYALAKSLPREYLFAFIGMGIVWIGGIGDLLWHTVFGIEVGVEALLSPTHLLLAIGGAMAVSGPLHAIWYRNRSLNSIQQIPVILSFAYLLMTMSFMLQFLSPYYFPWMSLEFSKFNPIPENFSAALGIANIFVLTGIFMGILLASIRHWTFPMGSFTTILTLNAIGITWMHGGHEYLVFGAIAGGFLVDVLYRSLSALEIHEGHIRLFGFLTPALITMMHLCATLIFSGTAWSIHMWTGSIVVAGFTGFLMTYLVFPPGDGTPRNELR